jgi:hypothetical protein
MTILDDAINVLAGNSDDTSSALRKLLVVGTRMQAQPIIDWCKQELTGYWAELYDDYPDYRRRLATPVIARWSGYGGAYRDFPLDGIVVPEEIRSMFNTSYGQPIGELEALARDEGAQVFWPLPVVQALRVFSNEGRAPRIEGHEIYAVWQLLSSTQIQGVVNAIRNRALMMALDLQQAFPRAGEPGGPTVQEEEVKNVVTNIYNTYMHGGMNTVAVGENNSQNVQINQGDIEQFTRAVKDLGLSAEHADELTDALEEDGRRPGNAVQKFLDKLSGGLIEVSGDTAKAAAITAVKTAITAFTGFPVS